MSFGCADNADDFMPYLSRVNDISETYLTPYVYVIDDLISNVIAKKDQCSSIFDETLLFCNDEGMLMADYDSTFVKSCIVLHIIM